MILTDKLSQLHEISTKNNYLYNNKEFQEETKQYDYGARFYDPVIGRFNVVDRFAEKYSDQSQYQYALNNPIKNIDINGDSTWTTNKQVRNGNNITHFRTTHIRGKVLNNAFSTVSANDLASSLNNRLNAQTGSQEITNESGGLTKYIYSIDAQYVGARSMDEVSSSDHLLVMVNEIKGGGDPNEGGGPAIGLGAEPGKIAYIEAGRGLSNMVNTAFHEVGHNLGLGHQSGGPMSYSGSRATFSPAQHFSIYMNADGGQSNRGSNSVQIINRVNRYNNISTNERPYIGNRSFGMRIPMPMKNPNP